MRRGLHIMMLTLLLSAFVLPIKVWGQNYAEDMGKISARLKNGDNTYHVKYLFYPYDSVHKAGDSLDILCSTSGNDSYCKVVSGAKSFEYIKNEKYYFIVDHAESAIAVKKGSESKQQMWDMSKVDSLIKIKGLKISYTSLTGDEGEYSLTMPGTQWGNMRIIFSKSSYTIEKIYLSSSEKGKMYGTHYNKPAIIMSFYGYSQKQLDKSIFSEVKYFHAEKNGLVLNEAFKKYKLLDYVNKNSGRS